MKNKLDTQGLNLLPSKFKFIGIALILGVIIFAILYKFVLATNTTATSGSFKIFMTNGIILGLLMLVCSRDKEEDEMTIAIRLQAMSWSFLWGALYIIIMPFIDMLFQDPIKQLSAQQLVMSMLFVYLIMYYTKKRNR